MINSTKFKMNVVKAVGGNPGALSVLMKVAVVDPELSMETSEVMIDTETEGHELWQLYKNVCELDLEKLMVQLRLWIVKNGVSKESVPLNTMFEEISP